MSDQEYKGWLVSNKLWKRSLAVLGHYFIGGLILWLPIVILMAITN